MSYRGPHGVDWGKPLTEIRAHEWSEIRAAVKRGIDEDGEPIEPVDGWIVSQSDTNDPILVMMPGDYDEHADASGIRLADVLGWVKTHRPELLK